MGQDILKVVDISAEDRKVVALAFDYAADFGETREAKKRYLAKATALQNSDAVLTEKRLFVKIKKSQK